MSLLTARRTKDPKIEELSGEMILDEFKEYLDNYIEKPSREALEHMIETYSIYSYIYLQSIAKDFRARPIMKDAMTYMNSVMAEVFTEQGIPYFHPEESYSCIDKACSYVLNEGEVGLGKHIAITIDALLEAKARQDAKAVDAEAMDVEEEV